MGYQEKYLTDYGILRDYQGNGYKLVSLACCRQRGIEEERKYTPKGEAGNEEKLENNLSRTRSRIFELALCNPWEWFITLTLDRKKYDRRDLPKFIKDFSQMVRDYRKKTGNAVKYLLIPERHKDGCWHLHGFLLGIPAEALHAFQRSEHLPHRILERLKSGVQIYTWQAYTQRFGFAVFEKIANHEAASKYITKYITKEAMNTITELNAHAFYASKGLQHSEVLMQDILAQAIQNPDYQNEYCAVKWFDSLSPALAHFEEVFA